MAKISIRHLGAINKIDFDIKQMNLFIGEQATGKSTLCKAIYFFRSFRKLLIDYCYMLEVNGNKGRGIVNELNTQIKNSFISLFGYSWQLPDDLYLKFYYTDENFITIYLGNSEKKYLTVTFSPNLKQRIVEMEEDALQNFKAVKSFGNDSLTQLENAQYYQKVLAQVDYLLDDDMDTYYIPAGRELLTLLWNQKTYINYNELDPLNRKFMQTIETLQGKFSSGIRHVNRYYPQKRRKFNLIEMCDKIIHDMKGEYYFHDGREYLRLEGGNDIIEINFASSGQQEALWLYNLLYILMLKDEKAFVIIEEPEAHLYPSLQKDIFDYIATFRNITDSSVVVTTHSPYLLSELNNLSVAGKLKKSYQNKLDISNLTGEKWNYVDPQKLNAYKLSNASKGTEIESLLDEDSCEIQAIKIDEISGEIDKVYTKLFYLEDSL